MQLYCGRKQRKAKKKRHFADYVVFLSIIAVAGFTVAAFVLQFKGLMEISATLTTCWFAFWTVEIIALASIRNQKTKHNYKNKEEENEIKIMEGMRGKSGVTPESEEISYE